MKRFEKGDHVWYGLNGVCLVEDIRTDAMTGKKTGEFYVLKPVSQRGATVLVPVDSETLVSRMSPLPTREELDRCILFAKGRELAWISDRKERGARFQQVLKRCDLQELLCMVGGIYHQRTHLARQGKKLPAFDESILRRAEDLIENEMSFVLDLKSDQVGAYIREKMEIAES